MRSYSLPASPAVWACVFFFFQAEDGIRDWSVTGVQTCALPIFLYCKIANSPIPLALVLPKGVCRSQCCLGVGRSRKIQSDGVASPNHLPGEPIDSDRKSVV